MSYNKQVSDNATANSTPVFRQARPVPYVMRDRVEGELETPDTDDIITKVDYNDWVKSVVPVGLVKADQSITICGDFKVTVNPVLQIHQYLLPRVEDIFASLAGRQEFSTFDLANAYRQILATPDSC